MILARVQTKTPGTKAWPLRKATQCSNVLKSFLAPLGTIVANSTQGRCLAIK